MTEPGMLPASGIGPKPSYPVEREEGDITQSYGAARLISVDYFSPCVRMGLQTAVALDSASLLHRAHVDICLPPGKRARALRRVVGRRAANRVVPGIAPDRIHNHPQLAVVARLRRRLLLAGRDTTVVDRMLSQMFRAIARQCDSAAVVGTQSSCLELFDGRTFRIMEQVSPPLRYERTVAAEELARFRGWAPEGVAKPRPWDHRMEAEWQEADLIWVPSRHLINISADFGADATKFRVIPYPVRPVPYMSRTKSLGSRRKLQVIFAGTLMLEKGVQYIYQALRNRSNLPVTVDFYGSANLAPLGLRRLSEVGTIHGPVPRTELFHKFLNADLLLFPSLSEGSALVTLEAAALGLPVVATEDAGPSASAMLIAPRSPEAISEALERLIDYRDHLESMSAAGLAETANRTASRYSMSIVNSIRSLSRRPVA